MVKTSQNIKISFIPFKKEDYAVQELHKREIVQEIDRAVVRWYYTREDYKK